VAPVPGLSNVATPQKLSSPSPPLYMDMGMVMMPKKGIPRDVQWAGAFLISYILKAEPDGYSDELCRPCTLYAPATSSCSVSLTTRTGSSSSLCRSVSSRRSLDDERGQGLCHVSTLYTTLVKKPQQANRASELWRTPLPRTRVNRGAERIGAAHPICGFGLNEAFRCALR
jgi:hypothetical protein